MAAGLSWERWIRGVEIEPLIYAGDSARLDDQLRALLDAGARIFHFDSANGHFMDEITIGPIVLKSISGLVHRRGGVLDCRLKMRVRIYTRRGERDRAWADPRHTRELGDEMKSTEELHELGQSIWLDNITRQMLDSGQLRAYIDDYSSFAA